MPKIIDKEAESLIGAEQNPEAMPVPANQVMFMASRSTAAAGGSLRARPPGSRARLSQDEQDELERREEERAQFIANDPVVQNANRKDPLSLLNALKMEVAREVAYLSYQRTLNDRLGKDSTPLVSRRIEAMKKIADIELEMRKIGVDHIDVHSEKFQKIFKFWIEMIQATAVATLGPEQSDLFFNRLTSEMEGWEEKAEELVR
jgi:hypothetical protein